MCFAREVIERHPWQAYSRAEDLEFGLFLLLHDINVMFAPEALVLATMPHSPQVAARATEHMLISKMEEIGSHRMVTRVQPLSAPSRREEIARMLSGAEVTAEARAAADRLLAPDLIFLSSDRGRG